MTERELSRLATQVENRDPQSLAALRAMPAGHARIIGITGPPGAGKSTLVDALAAAIRARGETLAILAVDPSSRFTGGAILGDRIRMQRHHADPGIFIRSMATRGTMGGLARATADLARLMSAAGRDYVLIETVGVGQDEMEIAGVAQVTIVVLVPGMGDDVQAIKAGIMEIASIFVINKADQPGADRVERELHAEGFTCPVIRTVATTAEGIPALLDAIGQVAEGGAGRSTHGAAGAPVLDHLGIAVADLDAALAFYRSLGLPLAGRETVAGEQVEVAMLPAGDSRIELLMPSAADSPVAKFLEKRGPGLHHIALRVPDLQATVAALAAAGARLLNEPRTGAGGHTYVFVHPASTGGVLLELIQEHTQ
ncbi:MAG: methylmalonyl Co-A mutase-associated GTPase MeaB [Candidatus Solibacter sp.]